MNRDQLKAEHPATFDAVRKEGFDAGREEGVTHATTAERARVTEIMATAKAAGAAHAELAGKAVAEGMSPGQFAQAVLQSEANARAAASAQIAAEAPKPLADAPAPVDKPAGATARQDLHQAVLAHQAANGGTYEAAYRAVTSRQRQAA